MPFMTRGGKVAIRVIVGANEVHVPIPPHKGNHLLQRFGEVKVVVFGEIDILGICLAN
jgi:hypothetical protein